MTDTRRSATEIRDKLDEMEAELLDAEEPYDSPERYMGWLEALEWVLDDGTTQSLEDETIEMWTQLGAEAFARHEQRQQTNQTD